MATADEGRKGMAARRGGVVDHIAAEMRRAIGSGRLSLGQRLIEGDMAREFGVSRGPVREAFGRLSAEGLIELVPHRGAVVRRLTRTEVADRFQIRAQLEGLAARLAAGRVADPAQRDRFLEALRPGEEDAGTIAGLRRDNYRLHGAIAEIAGNPLLATMVRQLWLPAAMLDLRGALDQQHWRESTCEHDRIAEAILSGDGDAAEALMRAHLLRALGTILALPVRVFGP
ncbi:GntR family transcriptional regulator [Muricoccus radiodurans]|uniref:GntR family transcriptional regulator n=1 Tax=Muricoccus radiodurans TaxID=2231721 RepID=UPI003CF5F8F0